jgi:D-sedoheptulose 7-phosphate isomerase
VTTSEFEAVAQQRVRESTGLLARLEEPEAVAALAAVARAVGDSYRGGGKLLLFGNGGSAAGAQHIAAEFVGRFLLERPAMPALALTTNTSALTALANDYAFELIFARQVEAFGQAGDVALGISTSGNSPNVIEGVRAARRAGLVTVGLTGRSGNALAEEVDHCLRAPSDETPRIQEAHVLMAHVVCELVEDDLHGGS